MNIDFLLDFIFPPRCLGCNAATSGEALCAPCRAAIVLHTAFFCGRCRARVPGTRRTCHPDVPYLLGAAASYTDARVRNLIHGLKFRNVRAAADSLGDIAAAYLAAIDIDTKPFTIVPIPLSPERRRKRGFNQSERIASALASRLGLPLETAALSRIRHSGPQSEIRDASERRENVRSVFSAARDRCPKNVLLVDDVATSGATMEEAAKALKGAGARRIVGLVAARA